MLNRNAVEGLETMHNAKTLAILLNDCEPTRTVRRVRGLVDAGVDFRLYNFADFVVKARWNRYVTFDPGLMQDNGDVDRGEEIFTEVSSFGIVPGEAFVLHADEVMQ